MYILGHRGTGVTMRNTSEQEEARRQEGKRFPENTLPAFEYVLVGGADGIELDTIQTAPDAAGKSDIAISHDEPLNLHVAGANRKTRELGFIYQKSMADLERLDMGDGQPMPSLNKMFTLLNRYQPKVFNIEIKGRDCYSLTHEQTRAASDAALYPGDRVIYSSFDHGQLAELRELDPTAKIGLLFETVAKRSAPLFPETPGDETSVAFSPAYVDSVLATIKPTSLHPWIGDFNDEMANYARTHGLDVYAWTMGEKPPEQDSTALNFARRYKDDPHVHLITDFPVEIVRALKIAP